MWSSVGIDPVTSEARTRFVRPTAGSWNEYQGGALFATFEEVLNDQTKPSEGVIPETVIMFDKSREIWIKLTKTEAHFQHGSSSAGIPSKWTLLTTGSFSVARINDQTSGVTVQKKSSLQFVNPKNIKVANSKPSSSL